MCKYIVNDNSQYILESRNCQGEIARFVDNEELVKTIHEEGLMERAVQGWKYKLD
jgi:hypothetical protein